MRSIIDGDTLYFQYNHFESVSSSLQIGSTITGDGSARFLGKSGISGNAAKAETAHVHIWAKRELDGVKYNVNPEIYMSTRFDAAGQAISVPCIAQ